METRFKVASAAIFAIAPWLASVFSVNAMFCNTSLAEHGPVERIATDRFEIEVDGEVLHAPHLIFQHSDAPDTEVTRLICLQHGAARNPFSYLSGMANAITAAGMKHNTVAVVFQWLEEKDINAHRDDTSLAVDRLLFFGGDWRAGDESLSTSRNPRPFRISNFEVIDQFLIASLERFPNLREITITGHSAGGQVVNRYAIGTRLEKSLPQDRELSIQFVIFNPSSYLYLDAKRWNELSDRFEVPEPQKIREVSTFNRFKYGLEDANKYFVSAQNDDAFASFPTRKVAYVVGENDNDPNHVDLDKNPEAMLQGSDRLSRGVIYFRYLNERFGSDLLKHQRFVILPNVGHNAAQCFASKSGMNLLFGVGVRDDGPIAKYGITNANQNPQSDLNLAP